MTHVVMDVMIYVTINGTIDVDSTTQHERRGREGQGASKHWQCVFAPGIVGTFQFDLRSYLSGDMSVMPIYVVSLFMAGTSMSGQAGA